MISIIKIKIFLSSGITLKISTCGEHEWKRGKKIFQMMNIADGVFQPNDCTRQVYGCFFMNFSVWDKCLVIKRNSIKNA